MIAERNTGRTVTSTLQGEVINMGIDQNAMAHIMNVLTDLYSNPLLAIIREYTTNAFDAMIEAGLGKTLPNGLMTLTRPIEVSLPNRLSPFLRIQDSGVGLDADDIRTIYSQYGNSTKRSTNDQVGMLGLGCKSALTYTDNFVVVSCKDGERVEVSIERNSEGAGVMKMPTVSQTNQPNGTTVVIPIKAEDTLKAVDIANDFFRFWQPGSVLVNGQEPKRIEGLDLEDNGRLLVYTGKQDYVVMGNVGYPVQSPLSIDHGLPVERWNQPPKSVVAFVDIGAVNFPPSRETLMATPVTKATIKDIEERVAAGLERAVQREVENAPTGHEAVAALLKNLSVLGSAAQSASYTWRGHNVPRSFVPAEKFEISKRDRWSTGPTMTGLLVTDNDTYKLSASDPRDSYPLEAMPNALIFYGYDTMAVSPTQKRKMRKYVEDNDLKAAKFVLVKDAPTLEQLRFLDGTRVIDFEKVKEVKLPTKDSSGATTTYGRLAGSYDFYNENGWNSGVAGDDIDQSKPIYWVHGRSGEASRFAAMLKQAHPGGYYVVALSANRIEKFKRIIPTALPARQGVVNYWQKVSKSYTADQRLVMHITDEYGVTDFESLDADKVLDPDLKAAIRLVKRVNVRDLMKQRGEFERLVDTGSLNPVQWVNPLEKYPLFAAVKEGSRWVSGRREKLAYGDQMYLYMNAAYTATTTTKGA
jgi:hypothetical protein